MDEVLNKLEELKDWYYENHHIGSIIDIMNVKDKIVCYSYNLAEMVSQFNKEYHTNYYMRKINVANRKLNFIKAGETVSKSDTMATVLCEQDLKNEIDAEAMAVRLDNLLKQINKLIDAMSQRISFMKKEYENSRNDV